VAAAGLSWHPPRLPAGARLLSFEVGYPCPGRCRAAPRPAGAAGTRHTSPPPTGKWAGEAEYGADKYVCNPGQQCRRRRQFATFCHIVYAPRDGFAAVKFDADLDDKTFYPCPRGT
jgi:hypothetical protein